MFTFAQSMTPTALITTRFPRLFHSAPAKQREHTRASHLQLHYRERERQYTHVLGELPTLPRLLNQPSALKQRSRLFQQSLGPDLISLNAFNRRECSQDVSSRYKILSQVSQRKRRLTVRPSFAES